MSLIQKGFKPTQRLGRFVVTLKDFQVVSSKCYTLQMVDLQLENSKSLLKKSAVSPFPSIKHRAVWSTRYKCFRFCKHPFGGGDSTLLFVSQPQLKQPTFSSGLAAALCRVLNWLPFEQRAEVLKCNNEFSP